MKSVHEALQVIARAAGLPSLDLNADGFAEIVLGGNLLSLYFYHADESQIEISARIVGLEGAMDDALAVQLLTENGQRDLGRFSVLEDGGVVLGHRIELGFETPASLIDTLNRFTREALTLERDGATALRARAEQHRAPADLPTEAFLRL